MERARKADASCSSNPLMTSIIEYVKDELDQPRVYQQVFSPILKRIIWSLFPYGIILLILNFFTTILAVGLVIFFQNRRAT